MAKSKLIKEWIGDKLVKAKVTEDLSRENFDNRTVLIRNFPTHLRLDHVLEMFGDANGAVVNVELPQ